ncbi:MAG TPA: hypothetical protein PL017_13545 [Tenuifilaceae bacterium]|nr:hypothetical protein [Tenuifilaceae bacterium]
MIQPLVNITYQPFFVSIQTSGERIKMLEGQRLILLVAVLALTAFIIIRHFVRKNGGKTFGSNEIKTKIPPGREIAESYFKGQDEERERISKELHDGACSAILGVRHIIEPFTYENEELKKAGNWLGSIHSDLRNMSHNLAPKELFNSNVDEALELLLSRLCSQNGKKFVYTSVPNSSWEIFPREIQQHVYRVVQEVLGNIVKHSNASNIEMSVSSIDGLISINLEDDSTNFDIKTGNGIGLETIKSRLSLISGNIEAFKTPQGAVYHIEARPQNSSKS